MRENCKFCQLVLKNCSDMIKCFKETHKGKGFGSIESIWVVCFLFIWTVSWLHVSWVLSSSLDICSCVEERRIDPSFHYLSVWSKIIHLVILSQSFLFYKLREIAFEPHDLSVKSLQPWHLIHCFCSPDHSSLNSRRNLRATSHDLGIKRMNQKERGSKPRDQCNPEQNKTYIALECFPKGTILDMKFWHLLKWEYFSPFVGGGWVIPGEGGGREH